ncbi:MAG: hypothetical protein ISEC1_P0681 [Thiomicrorhabdus sp.]|nr:MAG: hypothetical protein ISEC1_P0681 [Thiomicrorhabdus sp.]
MGWLKFMSKTRFSSALFEQIGGVNWQARTDIEFSLPQQVPLDVSLEPVLNEALDQVSNRTLNQAEAQSEVGAGSLDLVSGSISDPSHDLTTSHSIEIKAVSEEAFEVNIVAETSLLTPPAQKDVVPSGREPEVVIQEPSAEYKTSQVTSSEELVSVVVLGSGLDSVWQNEENIAWLLWQNIMHAFNWGESSVVFFDTANLVSEDMVFETMEEIIELGVEQVFTMDEEHLISEQLQEGVQVISVPDLESMLSDPYAKQSFYQSVMMSSTLN